MPNTSLRPTRALETLILLVEDDFSTRRFIRSFLKYATDAVVIEASDPDTAMALARAAGRPVDVLISDIDLCAANTGVDLAREVCATYPSAKVLLMSGNDSPGCDVPSNWKFLSKPFAISVFLGCVNELCACALPAKIAQLVTSEPAA